VAGGVTAVAAAAAAGRYYGYPYGLPNHYHNSHVCGYYYMYRLKQHCTITASAAASANAFYLLWAVLKTIRMLNSTRK